MKKSKLKRLVPKRLAQQLAAAHRAAPEALQAALRTHGGETVARMREKGYDLATCLDTGEGVFVREDQVVGLHIQLPEALYRRLTAACEERGATKRSMVVEALEKHLSAKR